MKTRERHCFYADPSYENPDPIRSCGAKKGRAKYYLCHHFLRQGARFESLFIKRVLRRQHDALRRAKQRLINPILLKKFKIDGAFIRLAVFTLSTALLNVNVFSFVISFALKDLLIRRPLFVSRFSRLPTSKHQAPKTCLAGHLRAQTVEW